MRGGAPLFGADPCFPSFEWQRRRISYGGRGMHIGVCGCDRHTINGKNTINGKISAVLMWPLSSCTQLRTHPRIRSPDRVRIRRIGSEFDSQVSSERVRSRSRDTSARPGAPAGRPRASGQWSGAAGSDRDIIRVRPDGDRTDRRPTLDLEFARASRVEAPLGTAARYPRRYPIHSNREPSGQRSHDSTVSTTTRVQAINLLVGLPQPARTSTGLSLLSSSTQEGSTLKPRAGVKGFKLFKRQDPSSHKDRIS
jgi:hypothetical protein